MGRKTGHLALGIGKAAGATLTLIPEEFKERKIHIEKVVKIIEGSIIKRLNAGRQYGLAVIAEGIIEKLYESDLEKSPIVVRDDMGRLRLSQFHVGQIIKNELDKKMEQRGIELIIVDKRVGYELRSSPPIPFDLKYTRDLGYIAVKFLINGGSGALITLKRGKMVAIKFKDLIDKKTGAAKVRHVKTNTESFEVAQKYMIKLNRDDLKDKKNVKKLSKIAKMKENEFINYFSEVI